MRLENDDSDDGTILEQIYYLIDNYERTEKEFSGYKRMIDEEFHSFEADTLKVFSVITGRDLPGKGSGEEELRSRIVDAVSAEDYRKALCYLTVCRISGYRIDDVILILEGYIRLGLFEEQAALYVMNGLLAKDDTNYEAYLIKARALLALGRAGADDALDLSVRYSTGTDDEDYISTAVKTLKTRYQITER